MQTFPVQGPTEADKKRAREAIEIANEAWQTDFQEATSSADRRRQ